MRGMLLFLIATTSFSAWAHRGGCRQDAAKFCKGITMTDPRVVDCLKSHESEISSTCKKSIAVREKKAAQLKAQLKAAQAACKSDTQNICKGVEPGQSRIHMCLKEHETQLSASCKVQLEKIPVMRSTASER